MEKLISNTQVDTFLKSLLFHLENCKSFIFNVAFINFSGIQLLLNTLNKLKEKSIQGKILTSTYLNFTDPKALDILLKFNNIELKLFEVNNQGFHPKSYIFEYEEYYIVIIGSSNITSSAFKFNIEWNIETLHKKDSLFLDDIFSQFNDLWRKSFFVDKNIIERYKTYRDFSYMKKGSFSLKEQKIEVNLMQKETLNRLSFLRTKKENKALAIAATGTGKTYLSAFDIHVYNPKKVLFLVHRENILLKAKETFESIIKNKQMGLYTGRVKEESSDYLFSTIQTMMINYLNFKREDFDYIVIDEAHHICSDSYKKIIDYFKPKFLLGLTATPNRMDGENIYKYFDDNIVCDIRLSEALENNLLVPFHYYGISDIIDFEKEKINIDSISEVSKALQVNKRVDFIIEKMNFYSFCGEKRKVLGFCISKEHAIFMEKEFNKKGINSIALTSNDSIEIREKSITNLEDDKSSLEVIFTVDIFNEGIDIPSINTILMLRPTDSSTIFTQQLGRGLRKYKNKEFLTVIDFIGNHTKNYLMILAFLGDKYIDKESIKLAIENNFANLSNIYIQIDEISKAKIITQVDTQSFSSFKYLKEQYNGIKKQLNKIPSIVDFVEFETQTLSVCNFIDESKSYIEFLKRVEKEEEFLKEFDNDSFIRAVRFIESFLPIKRIYEFVILKYLIEYNFISIDIAKIKLAKYLTKVSEKTIQHSFEHLAQSYLDKGQISRYLKLVYIKDEKLCKTKEFEDILKIKKYKNYIEESLEYGILVYEKKFGIADYGMPFLKLYEKYNMLNIAQLCNFDKIHSSFRGSGVLKYKDDFFLFITIEKDKYPSAKKYINIFSSKKRFSFVSKPTHVSDKGDGLKLCKNKELGIKLHIFTRKFSQVDKKTQPFIYLGLADTIKYESNKPIKLELELENSLSSELFEEFTRKI